MAQQINDSEPSTSSSQSEESTNLVRLPKIILERIDEKTILNLQSPTPKKSHKRVTKVTGKEKTVSKTSPKKTNETIVKRPRGRPKKINDENALSLFKKNHLKLGVKNKTVTTNKKLPNSKKNNLQIRFKNKTATFTKKQSKEDVKTQNKPERLLKKSILQNRSKVVIPVAKKTKVSPVKATKQKSPATFKTNPPKPKLEIIQSNTGENSSDTSGDEFLYDELIEELENTANKRIVDAKQEKPEKTTITLKPNAGNKPPTVLKGGIIKKTDLPSNLNLFAPSNKPISDSMANGQKKSKQTAVLTPGAKRKTSDIFGPSGPAKKSSPWPVSLVPSPKKSSSNISSQKKKPLTSKVEVTQHNTKPTTLMPQKTTYSPFDSPVALPKPNYQSNSISLGLQKPKIGPKQTAKVVPLSKSFDADEYLSDEYLEEETLECDLEVDQTTKETKTKSDSIKSHFSSTPSEEPHANLDLIKILTDESEEPTKIKSNEIKVKHIGSKINMQNIREEKEPPKEPTATNFDTTSEQKDIEIEEAPVRTIYDLMNEVFLDHPSWNLHIIPETSAFCIAQVTKGRLGLPTLKKCIELDPLSYNAKVYIHQYHIKRFDGVYDGEESILALIREIDSIKA